MNTEVIRSNYHALRVNHPKMIASEALIGARFVAEKGDRIYRKSRTYGIGAPSDDLRWCEDLASNGIRFVGFADKLASRAVDNTGWHTDAHGDGEVYRGAVFQIPGRNGCAQYVAGYVTQDGTRRDADRTPTQARIDFTTTFDGDPIREYHWEDGDDHIKSDAAIAADGIAKRAAETERDYQAAAFAGTRCAELIDEAKQARTETRKLVAELRALKGAAVNAPTVCATLRAAVASGRREVRELLESVNTLRNGGDYSREDGDAWNRHDAELRNVFAEHAGVPAL